MSDFTTSPCQAPAATPAPAQTSGSTSAPASAPGDAARVKDVAAQFESLLLSQMLTQMRQSVWDEGEDSKSGTEPLADTLYSELGLALSRAGGFGLADSLTGSMLQRAGLAPAGSAGAIGGIGTLGSRSPLQTGALGLLQTGSLGLPLTLPGGISLPAGLQGIALPTGLSGGIPLPANLAQALSAQTLGVPVQAPAVASPQAADVPAAGATSGAAAPADPGSAVISGPVSSPYGWRKDPIDGQAKFHSGTDVPMPVGSDVHAASDGRVTFVGERTGYGLTVEITHANGLVTRYAHLSASDVQPGDIVSAGQVIAASGNSGRSTGPHLHFEVMDNGQPIDPQGAGAVKLAELRRQSPD